MIKEAARHVPGKDLPSARAVLMLCTLVLGLVACDKQVPPTAEPIVNPPVSTPSVVSAASDPSVPEAEGVFPQASASQGASAPQPASGRLSDAQESRAMPLPGQNNDHSMATRPAASAP